MDDEFQALVTRGKKSQDEVDSMIQLANEVQYSVLTKKLVPGTSVLFPCAIRISNVIILQLCGLFTTVRLSSYLATHAFVYR